MKSGAKSAGNVDGALFTDDSDTSHVEEDCAVVVTLENSNPGLIRRVWQQQLTRQHFARSDTT